MNDMIRPKCEGQYRLSDFKRNRKVAGTFFNCLLSLQKFLAFESKDPFSLKQDLQDFPGYTDWDRFCRHEYDRLAADEEAEEYEDGARTSVEGETDMENG